MREVSRDQVRVRVKVSGFNSSDVRTPRGLPPGTVF
jgi:hypothetical protein